MVTSWLLDLTASALAKDAQLEGFSGHVEDSGEGRWTIEAAIEEAVPADVLAASLFVRFRSRQQHTFAEKVLSAMRLGFGGHVEAPKKYGGFAMRVGVFYFPTDYGIDIAELARALEDRGFDSLFVPEHTHIPLSRKSPFPGGGELPKRYSHTHDPFVGLAFAAAATKKLKVGTGILLVPQHEPIATAKAIASARPALGRPLRLRHRRRLERGRDGESRRPATQTRFKQMREHVLAMKALWTKEEASYHGEFVKFDPVWSWPKPAQRPHPPILLGGETDHTLKRVVDYCDGWFPRPRKGFEAAAVRRPPARDGGVGKAAIPRRYRSRCSARRPRTPRRWRLRQGRHRRRAAGDPRRQPRRHPALSRQDRAAGQGARVSVAVGLGLMDFPFAGAGDYWRWVDCARRAASIRSGRPTGW